MPLRFNYPSLLHLTRKKCTVAVSSSMAKIPVLVAFFFLLPMANRSLKMNCSCFLFCPYSQEFLPCAQMCKFGDGAWEKNSSDSPQLCLSVDVFMSHAGFFSYRDGNLTYGMVF